MTETVTPALPGAASRYGKKRPKVPAFARYEGTSAWRGNKKRVRAYALFLAAEKARAGGAASAS